jgi:hypothetical protein
MRHGPGHKKTRIWQNTAWVALGPERCLGRPGGSGQHQLEETPALEVGQKRRVAIRVADDLPHRVAVGVDAATLDAHQPITGNLRSAASRWTPACRLPRTLSYTAWSSPSTSSGSCASMTILAGSGM